MPSRRMKQAAQPTAAYTAAVEEFLENASALGRTDPGTRFGAQARRGAD